jgi:hypothetical protein
VLANVPGDPLMSREARLRASCKQDSAVRKLYGSGLGVLINYASYRQHSREYSGDRLEPVTPPIDPPGQTAELDSSALLKAASDAGTTTSDRMLETYRSQNLLPRPRRAGYRGRTPVWLYPPGTDRQLVCLLRWRSQTKDPDVLRVLLWLDGFPIEAADVRDALARHVERMSQFIEQALSAEARKLGLSPEDPDARSRAIDHLARAMAAKRGGTPIPRRSRVRADDRAHAVALLIRVFGLGETVQGTPAEGDTVERVLGIAPNGRRHTIAGAGPWLTGPPEELFSAAGIVALPRLHAAIADATDSDLETARQTVVALFRYLPLAVRMISVIFGKDDYAGLASMEQIATQPELVMWLLPAVTAMFKAGWDENLNAITAAFQPFPELAARAQAITEMPTATVEANLTDKPPGIREQVQRMIDAAIDGKLDIDQPGRP